MFILNYKPRHVPLKYRYSIKDSDHTKSKYLYIDYQQTKYSMKFDPNIWRYYKNDFFLFFSFLECKHY